MSVNGQSAVKYLFYHVFALMIIGVIMVYSSSYLFAKETFGHSAHFFIRQVFFVFSGIAIIFILSKSKFSFWSENSLGIVLVATALLSTTLIPGLGPKLKGAYRWIDMGVLHLQPGEFVKYAILNHAIYYFENFMNLSPNKKIIGASILLLPLGMLLRQPDFGTFTICLLVLAFVCFLSSFPRHWFYTFVSAGIISGITILFLAPYRVQRILIFLDPWKDPRSGGFQIIQSYLAFANGSLWGMGIGNSHEKLFYLPEAHNDFIFSVIGEEFGLIGVIFIIMIFLGLIYWGFYLSLQQVRREASIYMASVIFALGLQSFLNMGVVLGLLPTKGLNLPFISYGGSCLWANCMALGLYFSAVKEGNGRQVQDLTSLLWHQWNPWGQNKEESV